MWPSLVEVLEVLIHPPLRRHPFPTDTSAPRAGDDAVSPGDRTDLAPCDIGDAPPGEKAKKGITDLRAVHLIRAMYRRHRKHKSKSRTIRPGSKQKEK